MRKPSSRRIALGTAALLAGSIMASACNYVKPGDDRPTDYSTRSYHARNGSESMPTRLWALGTVDHNNAQLRYSQTYSDWIAEMNGLRDAYVFVTDKNAYVAIILDKTGTGMAGKGIKITSDKSITSNGSHYTQGTSRTLGYGEIISDKYSADTIPDHRDISSNLKQQLTAKIKSVVPEAQHVFISARKEYINEMSRFAGEAWKNRPLEPFLPRFNAVAKAEFGGA
ncbi:hypothetical protein [Paenibacillus sp. y28]|uniref:hypothetical protein n=1 Tax=Paenibacillus sp. y28 TaxID=3129110 RepID=UPI00301AC476